VGDDAGADARPLLDRVRLAAVERLPLADPDGRLVAAAAERDVKRRLHPVADLDDARAAGRHADAERHRNLLIHRHLAHFVQDDKARRLELLQRLHVGHDQEPVGVQSAQVHLIALGPVRDLGRHLRQQRRPVLVVHPLGHFLQVIHQNDAERELLIFVFPLEIPVIRHVENIDKPLLRLQLQLVDPLPEHGLERARLVPVFASQDGEQLGQRQADGRIPVQNARHVRVVPFHDLLVAVQQNAERQLVDHFAPDLSDSVPERAEIPLQFAPERPLREHRVDRHGAGQRESDQAEHPFIPGQRERHRRHQDERPDMMQPVPASD